MSSTALLIVDIRNKLAVSIGITFIFFGTVGNLLNIILFRKRALRTLSPCIPFLLAASIANLIDIYSVIMLRMLIGFKITPTFYSSVVCKLQLYLYYTTYCISSWLMVACCADRFFSSSRSANVRSYSNIRWTSRIILAIIIILLILYSEVFYCYEANQFNKPAPCFPQNDACNAVDIVFYFIFQAIGPPVFMLIFGIGTFIHIRQGRQIRQQPTSAAETGTRTISSILTRKTRRNGEEILSMLTIQVILYLICSMPFFATKIYSIIPLSINKSALRLSVENLIVNITVFISFIDKIFSFYIYTLSSKYYRQELIKLVTRCWPKRRNVPQN
jgi:hypothetical protein